MRNQNEVNVITLVKTVGIFAVAVLLVQAYLQHQTTTEPSASVDPLFVLLLVSLGGLLLFGFKMVEEELRHQGMLQPTRTWIGQDQDE